MGAYHAVENEAAYPTTACGISADRWWEWKPWAQTLASEKCNDCANALREP